MKLRRHLLGAAVAAALLAACSSDQDPGLVPVEGDTSATTSQLLQPCPAEGPDATTAAAGCLDPDGRVVRP